MSYEFPKWTCEYPKCNETLTQPVLDYDNKVRAACDEHRAEIIEIGVNSLWDGYNQVNDFE